MQLPFNYLAASWWLKKAYDMQFDARWIPQHVPTLIVSASNDFIVPAILFAEDERFKRSNIAFHLIPDAGHLPWLEQPEKIKTLLENFFNAFLITSNKSGMVK